MLSVIEVVVFDNKTQRESTLWFRGKDVEEAAERRNDYMTKHPHSQILRQQVLY